MKAMHTWHELNEHSLAVARDRRGGNLECDIDAYNARYVNKPETAYFPHRQRLDDFNLEREMEQNLQEVWDEKRR